MGPGELVEDDNPDTDGKKKRVYNNFTDEQEELLVNWLKENPILYNKGLKEYKHREKKAAIWTEEAEQLDIIEAQLHKWYKSMRTQFVRLIVKKSGDGARELTDRDKWILTSFDFLRTHIVRVPSRQAGINTAKLRRTGTSSFALLPSDDSDEAEEEGTSHELSVERPPSRVDPGEGTSSGPRPSTAAATATVPLKPQGKKKRKTSDPDLQELIAKLTDRVEGSREIREKVNDLLKAVENPHTAYASINSSGSVGGVSPQ